MERRRDNRRKLYDQNMSDYPSDRRQIGGRRRYDMVWIPTDGVGQWTPILRLIGGEDATQAQHSPQPQ